MPHYRFHLTFGDSGIAPRTLEMDMPSESRIWEEAVVALSEGLHQIGEHLGKAAVVQVHVEDEAGRALFEIQCNTRRLGRLH